MSTMLFIDEDSSTLPYRDVLNSRNNYCITNVLYFFEDQRFLYLQICVQNQKFDFVKLLHGFYRNRRRKKITARVFYQAGFV